MSRTGPSRAGSSGASTPRRQLGATSSVPGRVVSDKLILGLVAALGLVMLATALFTSTDFWIGFFEHPVRTERRGGTVAPTTVEGALWWRVALGASGVLLPGLLLGVWLLLRGAGSNAQAGAVADGRRESAAAPDASVEGDPIGLGSRAIFGWMPMTGLLAMGLALRLPRLTESLWYDEIADFLAFGQFGPGPTMGNYFTLSNHVLSGILCWLAMQVAGGANEVVLRLPALLASLASIPAFWWLGREVLRGAQVESATASTSLRTRDGTIEGMLRALPWCMAAFAALSPVMVLEAVEARGYALMILAAALANAAFLRGTRRSEPQGVGLGLWVLYICAIGLGTWAHLVTACVAVGHGLLLTWDFVDPRRRRLAAAGLLAVIAGGVLALTLFSPALPDLLAIRGEFRSLDGDEPTLFGPEGLHAVLQFGGAWSSWWALPGLALAALGGWAGVRRSWSRRALLATLLGAAVAVLLATIGNSWLYARFLLFTMPAAGLLVGLGMVTLGRIRRRSAVVAAAVVVMAAWLADLSTRPAKQPLREAVLAVEAARRPGEGVATIGLPDNVLAWYGAPREMRIESTGLLGSRLEEVLDRDRPAWIIVLYQRSVPPDRLEELGRRGFVEHLRLPGWVDWGAGEVVIWRRREPRVGE